MVARPVPEPPFILSVASEGRSRRTHWAPSRSAAAARVWYGKKKGPPRKDPAMPHRFMTLREIRRAAKTILPPGPWAFGAGGAETETTRRRNRRALKRLAIRQRVLRDVPSCRYQHNLSGPRIAHPLCHRADGRPGALSSGRRPRNGARSKPQPQPRLCERGHRLVGRRPGPDRPRPLDISALLERPAFLVSGFARPGGSLGLSRRLPDGGRTDL